MTIEIKFKGTEAINKEVNGIKTNGARLDKRIQEAALSIVAHIDEHREVTLANKLYHALPNGARKNALVEWFLKYGMITINTDKATKKEFPLAFDKSAKTNLEGASAEFWYECKKEAAPDVAFDLNSRIASLAKQLVNAQNKGLVIEGDEDTLKAFQVLAAKVSNIGKGDNNV